MLPTTHLRTENASARSEFQPPGPIFWHQNPGTIISQGRRRMGLSFLMLKYSSRLNELLRCYTFPHKTPHPHSSALVFHGELSRHSHCISPNISLASTAPPRTQQQQRSPRKLKNFATSQRLLPNTHLVTENTSVRSEFQPRRATFWHQKAGAIIL